MNEFTLHFEHASATRSEVSSAIAPTGPPATPRRVASLNDLLASHVWRQNYDGFTHQYAGFLGHAMG